MISRGVVSSAACLLSCVLAVTVCEAASLRVAPITVEVPQGAASALRLQNLERQPVDVQIRVFRWVQKDGKDQLLPTRDVVASPPFARLKPGGRNIIRIVRLAKRPVRGEESYRLLIDEVRRRKRARSPNVGIALRYSLPVFFGRASRGRVAWSATERGGYTYITATNLGERRAKLSALTVKAVRGRAVSFGQGLVGYVLGRSTATWKVRGTTGVRGRGRRVIITAKTEHDTIRQEAKLRTAQ